MTTLVKDPIVINVDIAETNTPVFVPETFEWYQRPVSTLDIPSLLGWDETEEFDTWNWLGDPPIGGGGTIIEDGTAGWFMIHSIKNGIHDALSNWYLVKLPAYVWAKRIIPAHYVDDITPARVLPTLNGNAGWNAGARSTESFVGNGEASFSVTGSVAGVVVGLNEVLNSEIISINDINYGLYFNSAKVVVIENGVIKSSQSSYASSDVFTINRTSSVITYAKNATVFYTSDVVSDAGFVLDSTLFLASDSIVDASITDNPEISNGDATLNGTISPMRGSIRGDGVVFSAVINSTLPKLTGRIELTNIAPIFASFSGLIHPMTGRVNVANGNVTINNTQLLPALRGFISDDQVAVINSTLPAVYGKILSKLNVFTGTALFLQAPGPKLTAVGTVRRALSNEIAVSAPSLSIYAAANASIPLTGPSLEAVGTLKPAIKVSLKAPAPSLSGTGTFKFLGQGAIKSAGPKLTVIPGGAGRINAAAPSLSGTGTVLVKANVTLNIAGPLVSGTATNIFKASISLAASAPTLARTLSFSLAVYAPLLSGKVIDFTVTQATVLNMALEEVTQYEQFNFINISRIGDKLIGIKSDGFYEITGDVDITTPVGAYIVTKNFDFNSYQSKHVSFMYLDNDTPVNVTPTVDGVNKITLPSSFNGRKVHLARGNSGRYWQFKIDDIKKLSGIEIIPEIRQRRVK